MDDQERIEASEKAAAHWQPSLVDVMPGYARECYAEGYAAAIGELKEKTELIRQRDLLLATILEIREIAERQLLGDVYELTTGVLIMTGLPVDGIGVAMPLS